MRIIRKPEKNISKEMIGLFLRTSITLQTAVCMRR